MKSADRRSTAFSLVEVTLAMAVASFCLLTMYGLLPVGVKTNRDSVDQGIAADILTAVVADMRATPITSDTSAQFGVDLGSGGDQTIYFDADGGILTSQTGARYALTITLITNQSGDSAATLAHLTLSWPAGQNASPTGSAQTFAAFNRT